MNAFTHIRRAQDLIIKVMTYCVFVPSIVLNCNGEIGGGAGLNQNQQSSGNQEGGIDLSWDQIAIDPTGTYLISNRYDQVIYGEIKTGESRVLQGISSVSRLAFGRDQIMYCNAFYKGQRSLVAYDVRADQVLWFVPGFTYSMIDISHDQTRLITIDHRRLRVLDVQDGKILFDTSFDHNVEDLDLHPTEDRILVTLNHEWVGDVPETHIISISWEELAAPARSEEIEVAEAVDTSDTASDAVSDVEVKAQQRAAQRSLLVDETSVDRLQWPHLPEHVRRLEMLARPEIKIIKIPNCSSELTLTPDGKRAFLAPTSCAKDPVSVIDLVADQFVRNLPGFGPVAMSPSGDTAIAFINMNNVEEHLFDDPAQLPSRDQGVYHLMLINVSDLSFKTMPLGDTLPRYALTPDGQMLLIDDAYVSRDVATIRILDVDTLTLNEVEGPSVRLLHFVLTSDSERALLIDEHLYELSIEERRVDKLDLHIVPTRLNLTPDDRRLIIRSDEGELWIFDLVSRHMERRLNLPPSVYDSFEGYLEDHFQEYFE